MAIKVKATNESTGSGEARPIPTTGDHAAAFAAVVGMGHHKGKFLDSGKEYEREKVYLCWELRDDEQDGASFFVCTDANITWGENSKLRRLLEGLNGGPYPEGKELDLRSLVVGKDGKPAGAACRVTINHETSKTTGRTYPVVASIAKLPKAMKALEPTQAPYYGDRKDGRLVDLPDWLPWLYGRELAEHLAESEEAKAGAAEAEEGEVTAGAASDPF